MAAMESVTITNRGCKSHNDKQKAMQQDIRHDKTLSNDWKYFVLLVTQFPLRFFFFSALLRVSQLIFSLTIILSMSCIFLLAAQL